MELYQFSWGSGSDEERYSFFANTHREAIVALMSSFQNADGYVRDFDEFESYASEHGVEINRYYNDEPTFIHEDELSQ